MIRWAWKKNMVDLLQSFTASLLLVLLLNSRRTWTFQKASLLFTRDLVSVLLASHLPPGGTGGWWEELPKSNLTLFVCQVFIPVNMKGLFFKKKKQLFSRLFSNIVLRRLTCHFTRYFTLQSLWSLVVDAGDWLHFLYSLTKSFVTLYFSSFSGVGGRRRDDADLWSHSCLSILVFVYIHNFLSYDVQLCGTLAAWRRSCFASCFFFLPLPPVVQTSRFCSTQMRKIQRCLFLNGKSWCFLLFFLFLVFTSVFLGGA